MCREIEGALLIIAAADHRFDFTGLIVDNDDGCGWAVGIGEILINCLLRGLLEVEVECCADAQTALERTPSAEMVYELLTNPGSEVRRLGVDRWRDD